MGRKMQGMYRFFPVRGLQKPGMCIIMSETDEEQGTRRVTHSEPGLV